MASVLIIDDEPNIRRMLAALLASEGYEARDAPDGAQGVAAARDTEPDAVLLDLMMPGPLDGLATLSRLRDHNPELPVIMMSGRAGLSDAVRATKLGAFNFLEKPLAPETVLLALAAALELRQARQAARALREELGLMGQLVGASTPMRRVGELIARIAPTDSRVLISGESGTGKELVAAAIHEASARRDRPFVRVNCAAIPRDLVESEMFGHERGAFTGATERRIGRFELAHTGTLFLDEVADLGAEAQAKLLRAIEAKEIERLGGAKPIRTDVRIVAATNKDLARAVREGAFREDLYFRLNVIPLALPPLRERRDDIPALVEHFTLMQRTRTGRALAAWSAEAMRLLTDYWWPGNVRELANIIERLAILHPGETVTPQHIQSVLPLQGEGPVPPRTTTPPRETVAVEGPRTKAGREVTRTGGGGRPAGSAAGSDHEMPLAEALDVYERGLITQALAAANGSITEAARHLRTDRANLYRRMRRLGITVASVLLVVAVLVATWTRAAQAQGGQRDSTARGAAADSTIRAGPSDSAGQRRDTTTLVGQDTVPGETAQWWRRWLQRSRAPNYLQLSISSAHTYNRVEGLPIYAGPVGRRQFPWGSVSGEAYGILRVSDKLRWDEYHIGQMAHVELHAGGGAGRGLAIGGRLYDVIDPVESWQLSDGEVGLATLFLHRDYRDYFGRHGASGYVSLFDGADITLTVGYGYERWASRPVRTPFTVFRNTATWRPNPAVDDGVFQVFTAHLGLDTRNDAADPWAGWFATLDLERGAGRVTLFGPRSDDSPTPVPRLGGSPVTYVRGFFDGRRYNRVGPEEQLNFRLVLGGWLGGDRLPLERRFSIGGAGTLPGFFFRNPGTPPDVATCSATLARAPGGPAQCDRVALAQVEFRHDLRVGLADLIRGFPLDGSWVVFGDVGRGWLVGPRAGKLRYPSSQLPPLGTARVDAGLGLTLGPFGFYVAQAVSPWDDVNGPRLAIRLQQRF